MKSILQLMVFVLLISMNARSQRPAETIPAFSFFKLDKTIFTHKNLPAGKPLFFVYFDAGCDHCQHAIQYINDHHRAFQKAAIYLVTLDSQDKIRSFMRQFGNKLINDKNVTILQDTKNEFLQKFRPRKYPSLYLYSSRRELMVYDDDEKNLGGFIQRLK